MVTALLTLSACGRVGFQSHGDAAASQDVATSPNRILSAGGINTCTVHNGTTYCWGFLTELGREASGSSNTPAPVTGPSNFDLLEVNDTAVCGRRDGSVYCWGQNMFGELSVGNRDPLPLPTRIMAPPDVTSIATGHSTLCVIADNRVYCAGKETALGDSPIGSELLQEVKIPLDGSVVPVAIENGDGPKCVLTSTGEVWCWGQPIVGVPASSPQKRSDGPYSQIAVGDFHVCGLRTVDNGVDCWGENAHKELGRDGPDTLTPGGVPNLVGVRKIAAAGHNTCVLIESGQVLCWGLGSSGVNGSANENSTTPALIEISDVVDISGGSSLHMCALKPDNSIWCWGNNMWDQVGGGTVPEIVTVPRQVTLP